MKSLMFLLLALPTVLQAQFMFTSNSDGSLTITNYIGSGGAVVIPNTINGQPVTGIGDYAFSIERFNVFDPNTG